MIRASVTVLTVVNTKCIKCKNLFINIFLHRWILPRYTSWWYCIQLISIHCNSLLLPMKSKNIFYDFVYIRLSFKKCRRYFLIDISTKPVIRQLKNGTTNKYLHFMHTRIILMCDCIYKFYIAFECVQCSYIFMYKWTHSRFRFCKCTCNVLCVCVCGFS